MRRLCVLIATVSVLAGVWAASAQASVQAYNEPTYTKTTGNDAFFWHWVAVNGTDENANTVYTYYLCFSTYRDGVTVETSNGTTGGPGSSNCTTSLRASASPSSGDFAATPFTSATVLDDGHTYTMCASGYYRWPYLPWKLDAANIGNCATTTIDRTKPLIGVAVDGTAEVTKDPVLQVRIDYQDATSPPWQGAGGLASNWVCVNRGGPCSPGGSPNAACSQAANPASRTTSFTCTADVSSAADGDWFVCAMSADSAIPDNPAGTNQFAQATSNNANISTPLCGHVVVDRVAPVVTATASANALTTGQLVTLTATSTDASSGTTGTYDWDFGDNTPHGSGATATHTYTQPGTYVARATTADGAGNSGQATTTITVTAPPSGGTTPSGTSGGTSGSSGTPGSSNGGTTTSPPPVTASGAASVTAPSTPAAISQQTGGGGTQRTTVGGLQVVAPKRLTLSGKRRTLPLVLTVDRAGSVDATLIRGARITAKGTAKIARAGSVGFSLKLPSRPRPGRYKLRLVFRPRSGRAVTKTLTVSFVAPKAKPRAAAIPVVGIPTARAVR